jgi:hypothetical protein
LLKDIDSVVKDVKKRVNDYEEYKSSFIDPEANTPYNIPSPTNKSPLYSSEKNVS